MLASIVSVPPCVEIMLERESGLVSGKGNRNLEDGGMVRWQFWSSLVFMMAKEVQEWCWGQKRLAGAPQV